MSNDLPRRLGFFFSNTTKIGCWKFIRPESPVYPLKLVPELMLPGEIWRGTWCEIGFQIWVIDHIIACLLVFPKKQTKLEIVGRVAELWNVLLEPFNESLWDGCVILFSNYCWHQPARSRFPSEYQVQTNTVQRVIVHLVYSGDVRQTGMVPCCLAYGGFHGTNLHTDWCRYYVAYYAIDFVRICRRSEPCVSLHWKIGAVSNN